MPFIKEIPNNKFQITNNKLRSSRNKLFNIGYWSFVIGHLLFSAKRRGFTLIELLIVITIIGILVATGTYSWQGAQAKARDNRRKADLKSIQQALEAFYQTNGKYPPASNPGVWCTQISNGTYQDVKNALQPNYMTTIPQDPVNKGNTLDYFYSVPASRMNYRLFATMENTKDPDYISGDLLTAEGLGYCAGYNANYHYKVTNP